MLITIYGNPDSGKTTMARHLARKYGNTIIFAGEGRITAHENETVVSIPGKQEPRQFLREWVAANKETWEQAQAVVIDSITSVNDLYGEHSLARCLNDDKMKNKSKAEKEAMTLSTIPFGMGESTRAELVKGFIESLVAISAKKQVIVTAHSMLISVISGDQVQSDVVSIALGGKAEKSASSRLALIQHSDAIVYCDATPHKNGNKQEPQRRAFIGNQGFLVTKYKSNLFGKDEFFEPEDYYTILGKEALLKFINTML